MPGRIPEDDVLRFSTKYTDHETGLIYFGQECDKGEASQGKISERRHTSGADQAVATAGNNVMKGRRASPHNFTLRVKLCWLRREAPPAGLSPSVKGLPGQRL